MTSGHLDEVFLSFQGEGTHLGRIHVFLRLGGCPLRCRYCDTPAALTRSPTYRVALPDGADARRENPVSAKEAAALPDEIDPNGAAAEIAVTGGEPLHQPEFLESLLPLLTPQRRIYLETAGVHPEALERVIDHVATVAMDIKLPSVSEEGDRFREHEEFLRVAVRRELMCKLIVSSKTVMTELERAAELVAAFDRDIPFILQPETDRRSGKPASGPWLMGAMRTASTILHDVRVIPQTHKFIGVD